MRVPCAWQWSLLLIGLALPWRAGAAGWEPAGSGAVSVDGDTWVDHDRQPISRPPDWEPSFWGHQFRESLVEPLSHVFDVPDKLLAVARLFGARTDREAVNVNAFDEVPNSTWFTNRNHVRAVPVADLRQGPDSAFQPPKPWTITHSKQGGTSPGFQIKDAAGGKWLVKLDPRDHPQLSSGADMVARTLVHAFGYNVPHNAAVRFRRGDLTIGGDLQSGAKGERLTETGLDTLLACGALFPDSSYSAMASLFLSGHVLGAPSMRWRRPGDANDRYAHPDRRELRGLYVLCSWVGDWDTKDHNLLDLFVDAGGHDLGYVDHYQLDLGSSLGASSTGPKELSQGYEKTIDFGWIARRVVTLGFVVEPWRRARQLSGIPSVGTFESAVYEPARFTPQQAHACFREMTDRDGYWGAKIVASFSDAQVAAAVDAAHYEDPRASQYLVRCLIERRDKVARHWFGRVAPLDFFSVRDGELRFHDLAVDVGLEQARGYEVEVESEGGGGPARRTIHRDQPGVSLQDLGSGASRMSLELRVSGSGASPARVELARKDSAWVVTSVRHG